VAIQDRTTALRDHRNSITGSIVLFRSPTPMATHRKRGHHARWSG